MVERLRDYLQGRSCRAFKSVPHYFASGDFLTYFIRDERPVARREDDLLTVYRSRQTQEIIGFKIKGVRQILEKAGRFGICVDDGEVKLGMFFFYLSRSAKNEPMIKTYDELGAIARDVSIPKDAFDEIQQ
jgi:hypothetical protein